jgi:hypothetical protein
MTMASKAASPSGTCCGLPIAGAPDFERTELQTPVINLNPAEICGLLVLRAALGADEVIK